MLLGEFSSLNLSNEVNSKVQTMRELSFLFLKKIICCTISKNRKDLGWVIHHAVISHQEVMRVIIIRKEQERHLCFMLALAGFQL